LPEDFSDILSAKLPWARTYPPAWQGKLLHVGSYPVGSYFNLKFIFSF
jgi:hypothetical protein